MGASRHRVFLDDLLGEAPRAGPTSPPAPGRGRNVATGGSACDIGRAADSTVKGVRLRHASLRMSCIVARWLRPNWREHDELMDLLMVAREAPDWRRPRVRSPIPPTRAQWCRNCRTVRRLARCWPPGARRAGAVQSARPGGRPGRHRRAMQRARPRAVVLLRARPGPRVARRGPAAGGRHPRAAQRPIAALGQAGPRTPSAS